MPKKILLVDDEPLLIKGLKFSLEQEGYETDEALDGESAMEKFESGAYDLVLLDVMLPKLSGIEVCQRIREQSQVPIIMLTAKGEDMDKILGLEFGADDYMTKPFNILEVKARIRSIFRRMSMSFSNAEPAQKQEAAQETHVLTSGALSINILSRSAFINGADAGLTAKEYDLLHLFMCICSWSTPARCLRARNCSKPSGNTTIWAISVRWTCISAACARKSSPTRQSQRT